jgi:hypothetical protein
MKVTLHVSWKKYDWKIEPFMHLTSYEVSDKDCIKMGSFEVDVPDEFAAPPAAAFVAAKVDALRAAQGVKQAEITDIQRQIDELLCLEHKE